MREDDGEPLFKPAAMMWPERWNDIPDTVPIAGITDVGKDSMMLTTCLGWVVFNPRRDGPHLLQQLDAAVKLLKENLDLLNRDKG